MYNKFLNIKNKTRFVSKKKSFVLNGCFLGTPELKHTHNRVIINIYIYLLREKILLKKIESLISPKFFINIRYILKRNLIKFLKDIRKKNNKLLLKLGIKGKLLKNFEKLYINKLIKRSFKKEIFVMHFLQSIFFYRLKNTSLYIQPLLVILRRLYGKKVVLNIVKLKTYYFNSDILTQIIAIKLGKKKSNIQKILGTVLFRIKPVKFSKKYIEHEGNKKIYAQNILVSNSKLHSNRKISNFIKNNYSINTRLNILNSLKNKSINGVRLEVSGKLSKRVAASRSATIRKYKGTTKNVVSSYEGSSSVIIRGNTTSNTMYSALNLKNRLGAFGLKG
jgi:hypothetical protein